jgi:hypothetical protein
MLTMPGAGGCTRIVILNEVKDLARSAARQPAG